MGSKNGRIDSKDLYSPVLKAHGEIITGTKNKERKLISPTTQMVSMN